MQTNLCNNALLRAKQASFRSLVTTDLCAVRGNSHGCLLLALLAVVLMGCIAW